MQEKAFNSTNCLELKKSNFDTSIRFYKKPSKLAKVRGRGSCRLSRVQGVFMENRMKTKDFERH